MVYLISKKGFLMLVQFSVENYVSFKDEVRLNMIPAKSRTMKDHVISDKHGKQIDVLPLATIYGANASGKTNLVKAIRYMKNIVLSGIKVDSLTGVLPHKLDAESEKKPSRFEIIFKHQNVLYTYGFVITREKVLEEWLFGYYTSQESRIFERITNENNETKVKPGARLTDDGQGADFIKFVAKGTRPNQLFLNEAHERNVKIISPVIDWFKDCLHIVRPNTQYSLLTFRAHKERNFIDYLSKFLRNVDTGIKNITCDIEDFDANKHLGDLPSGIKKEIIEDLESSKTKNLYIQGPNASFTILKEVTDNRERVQYIRLRTEHERSDGSSTMFDPIDESDGTRRLMDLIPMLFEIWESEKVYIIDELDRSLHTHLSRLFIETVIAGVKSKGSGGQFIVTTHDTNLLDRKLLRKDEIYFMEKDKNGGSHLTSLAEYKLSEGLNYENGYLNGRFGGIPFVGNTHELLK